MGKQSKSKAQRTANPVEPAFITFFIQQVRLQLQRETEISIARLAPEYREQFRLWADKKLREFDDKYMIRETNDNPGTDSDQ